MEKITYHPVGEAAVEVVFGQEIKEEINHQVHQFVIELTKAKHRGIREIIPAYCTVLITYDPLILSYKKIVSVLRTKVNVNDIKGVPNKRIIHIPVCYEGEFAIDLQEVAEYVHMTCEEVIQLHSSCDYLIYMLGFLPGFAYLGGLDEKLAVPRLATSRTRIEVGSVGIGGKQTGIYPMDSPGGWRLIGRTPLKVYDETREEPFLYQAGDYIHFDPITRAEYDQISQSGVYPKESKDFLERR